MSKGLSIPEFSTDPQSMENAMRAMKEILENLTGQRPSQGLGAPRIFVEVNAPTILSGQGLKLGDLWIQKGSDRVKYWDGRLWRGITT